MMPANIEECPELPISVTHHHHRLACNLHGDVLPRLRNLFSAAYTLPICPENSASLQLRNSRIGIPGRRYRRRFLQRKLIVVPAQHVLNRLVQCAPSMTAGSAASVNDLNGECRGIAEMTA